MATVLDHPAGTHLVCPSCRGTKRYCDHHLKCPAVKAQVMADFQKLHRQCPERVQRKAPTAKPVRPLVVAASPEAQWSRISELMKEAGLTPSERDFFKPLEAQMVDFVKEQRDAQVA